MRSPLASCESACDLPTISCASACDLPSPPVNLRAISPRLLCICVRSPPTRPRARTRLSCGDARSGSPRRTRTSAGSRPATLCPRLQPYVSPPATLRVPACNPMCPRLQPYVPACNPMCPSLQPYVSSLHLCCFYPGTPKHPRLQPHASRTATLRIPACNPTCGRSV